MSLTNIFDSHAHYDDEAFSADLPKLLEALPESGVTGVISCGVNMETSQFAVRLSKEYGYIYAAAGFHPLNLQDAPADVAEALRPLLAEKKTVALGEIGLDYHYEKETRNEQLALFEAQLKLARELDIPVIVHDRESHEDTMRLLERYRPRGVVHCFSGSTQMAQAVLRLGMYIGLGGAVTFRNAKKPVEVAAMVPPERLLVETDAPYMAPVPCRGTRCDSRMIAHTAQRLAEIRGVAAQEILDRSAQNAKTLFGIE